MREYVTPLSLFVVLLFLGIASPINAVADVRMTGREVEAGTVEDIINPLPEQYVNYTNNAYYLDGRLKYRGWWNISYLYYVQPHVINSTQTVVRPVFPKQNGTSWMTIDKTNRWVVNGTHWWNETWYTGWIETSVKKGSVINFWIGTERISGSQTIVWNGIAVDTWVIDFRDPYGYEKDLMYFDKQTGVLIMCLTEYTLLDFTENQTLVETNIPIGGHDVAVTSVKPSSTHAYAGYTIVDVLVKVTNHGKFSEIFNVTAYCSSTAIEAQTVTDLAPNANATLTFSWNVSDIAYGCYIVSASASRVKDEIDISDNSSTDGIITVTIPGDVNGDRRVETSDLLDLSKAYGSTLDAPGWNSYCDFNGDNKVDVSDLFDLSKNYGKTAP